MQMLEAIQDAVTTTAEAVGPSVVGLGRGWGRGSGVVVAPGRVLTNAHVLRGQEVGVGFAGGRIEHGRLLAADVDLDVAVLDVDTGDAPAIAWREEDAAAPAPGMPVFSVADPGGRGLRTTFGLVSAVERAFRGPRGRRIGGSIEHTAPVPAGAAGSPLVDAAGRLVGLNTVRVQGGFVLALPADARLRGLVERLARGEPVARPRLGVALVPPAAARRLRRAVGLPERDGLLVRAVEAGGPADRAGIQGGDLLVSAAGRPLRTPDQLFDVLDAAGPELALGILRGTAEHETVARFAS